MVIKYKLLSYILSEQTLLYGDGGPLQIMAKKQIGKGDSCNTYKICFENHSGSHLDAPNHFFAAGRSVSQYTMAELVFNEPLLIDCPKKEDELVIPDDLGALRRCDLLLIRTGFHRRREESAYRSNNPGLAPETAEWLRAKHSYVRALGIDAISVSAFAKRNLGRKTHRILLGNEGYASEPIIILEDLDLSGDLRGLQRVLVAPLLVEKIDSAPCTVIGEFR